MGQRVAHKVNPAALPCGGENLRDSSLDALMGVGDDKLDAAQAPAGKLAQEAGPERFSLGLGPISMPGISPRISPRISRRPSALTPTAMMTATETMRPFWRTFT
jgi:hypothetical protein